MSDRFGLIKESTDDGQCEVRVNDMGGWHDHRCKNRAKTTVNGAHYCGTHDPAKKLVLDKKRQEGWDKKFAKDEYAWYANKYCIMQGLTIQDLKKTCESCE